MQRLRILESHGWYRSDFSGNAFALGKRILRGSTDGWPYDPGVSRLVRYVSALDVRQLVLITSLRKVLLAYIAKAQVSLSRI
jgi:hypothetical protein